MAMKFDEDTGFVYYECGIGLIDGIDDEEHRALLLSLNINDVGEGSWAVLRLPSIEIVPADRIVRVIASEWGDTQ